MNLLQYIKQNYDKFTDREKLIADYLLLENIKIVDMSAKEIAEATKTSAPTVVRFAKKLGFSSLNEMKIKLSISLNEKKSNGEFKYLDKDLSTRSIVNGVKSSIHSIIDETVDLISEEELDKAVELLTNAKTIYIFSVGVSSLVGLDFYYKLSRINKRCIVHEDTHLQVTSSVLMQEGDVAVVISYSGETKEVLLCAKNARENNVPVIGITKASIDNKLESFSDISLHVPYVEKSLREGAMTSRISQLAIIDMLFLGMARSNIRDVEEKLVITREAIKELR
ncbi:MULTISPECIES: MurR/RpiR family transcriptional regulator [unclassified Clostridium]|uniref:MurR/RpiR family transcriptional regulator n=1 Tax=unclassified Clostridium TaxID=2614128 RepID=UPI001C8B329E|nr:MULTISPECIES: MurR/RpiR family transcriptional regulator [unclassified Clostridium]MBX9138376.1 MurR/RpiR family transcriptional regulator [Clostridium sp. K12(2020)]MBX9145131.1 MurR/RpiR family transcriptional regulator [Clostridium sp. K13]